MHSVRPADRGERPHRAEQRRQLVQVQVDGPALAGRELWREQPADHGARVGTAAGHLRRPVAVAQHVRTEVTAGHAHGARRADAAEVESISVDLAQPPLDQRELRCLGEGGRNGRQDVAVEQVVGVEEHENVAGGGGSSRGGGRRLPLVRLADRDDPVAEPGDHVPGLIGRAVVDDDDLNIRVGLVDRRIDRRADVAGVVVAGHAHRDTGHGHPPVSVLRRRAIR